MKTPRTSLELVNYIRSSSYTCLALAYLILQPNHEILSYRWLPSSTYHCYSCSLKPQNPLNDRLNRIGCPLVLQIVPSSMRGYVMLPWPCFCSVTREASLASVLLNPYMKGGIGIPANRYQLHRNWLKQKDNTPRRIPAICSALLLDTC